MEEQTEERLPGPDQEGGGEEDDGAADDRGDAQPCEEAEHQDLQRDRGGQVGGAWTHQQVSPLWSGSGQRL